MSDNRYFKVDGWLSYYGQPYIKLVDIGGRSHTLTLAEVRALLADIHTEVKRLDDERNTTNGTDPDSLS